MTIESIIGTVFLDVINVLLIDYFFSAFGERRWKNKYLYLGLMMVLCSVVDVCLIKVRTDVIIDSLSLIVMSLQYSLQLKKRCKLTMTFWILRIVLDIGVYLMFSFVFNRNVLELGIYGNDVLMNCSSIVSKYLIYLSVYGVVYKKNVDQKLYTKIFKYISLLVSIFYGVSIVSYFNELLFYHVGVGRIFVFTLILYNTVLVIFNFYEANHLKTVNQLETIKNNRDSQLQYNKQYIEYQENIRRIKHDLLSSYGGLYGLMRTGKYEEAKGYLESKVTELKELEGVVYFNNPMIDCVLSMKINEAKKLGIKINFNCGFIDIGNINEDDLGVLLGNALDNAIEATVKSEYNEIDVNIRSAYGCLFIRVVNYVDDIKKVHFHMTSKSDKANHGIGIKSMKQIVKRYHGEMEFEKGDNQVVLSVTMLIE